MLSLTSFAQLSGSYTIDPNGTGTNNYTSFSAATSALSTSGVNGAVTFYVKQGTYTEQVSLGAYTGPRRQIRSLLKVIRQIRQTQ